MKQSFSIRGAAAGAAIVLTVLVFGSSGASALASTRTASPYVVLGEEPAPNCTPGIDDNCTTATTAIRGGSTAFQAHGSTTGLEGRGEVGVLGVGDLWGVLASGGVYGVYGQNGTSAAVFGENTSETASGVYGLNHGTGAGVAGAADDGIGIVASSARGTALDVEGVASFSRSGLATIPAGSSTKVVTAVALSTRSLILLTAQNNVTGVYATSAVPNVAGSKFTIHLNSAVPTGKTLKVAWFVVN